MDVAERFKTAKTGNIAQEATRLASVFQRPNASGAELIRAKRLLDSLRKFNASGEIPVEGTQVLDLRNASNRARSQLHTNKDIDAFLKEQEASLNVAGSVLDKLAIGTKDYIQDTGGLGLLSAGSAVSGAGSGVAVAGALRAFANKARLPLAKVLYRGVGGKTTPIPALPPRAAVNFGVSTPPSAGQPTPPNAGPTLPPGANKSALPPSNKTGGQTSNGPTRPSSGNQQPGRPQVPDPYDTLGVSRNATAAEIKSAYRDLARQNHPDTLAGTLGNMLNPEAMKVKIAEATARMRIINAAWDRLKPRK